MPFRHIGNTPFVNSGILVKFMIEIDQYATQLYTVNQILNRDRDRDRDRFFLSKTLLIPLNVLTA